jgi:hypothetical protein
MCFLGPEFSLLNLLGRTVTTGEAYGAKEEGLFTKYSTQNHNIRVGCLNYVTSIVIVYFFRISLTQLGLRLYIDLSLYNSSPPYEVIRCFRYILTPCNEVRLKNCKSHSLSGNSLLPGTRRSIIVFRRACSQTLSWATWMQSTPSCTISFKILYFTKNIELVYNTYAI